jgi:hypothetical protein
MGLRDVAAAICIAVVCAAGPSTVSAQNQIAGPAGPDDVQWKSTVGFGVMIATIQGDPSKPEMYVQRIKYPPAFSTDLTSITTIGRSRYSRAPGMSVSATNGIPPQRLP